MADIEHKVAVGGREYAATIHEAEEGGYWAEVPELPGCITEADTLKELKANIADAAQGWLDAQRSRVISVSLPGRALRRRRESVLA